MLIRPKISGPETLLNLYVAIDEDLTVLHPQLQIMLSAVMMVLLVRDESTFSLSPGDEELTDSLFVSLWSEASVTLSRAKWGASRRRFSRQRFAE